MLLVRYHLPFQQNELFHLPYMAVAEISPGKNRPTIKDDTESALISLDQSKAFDRVDHRFLASVLETAGFKPEFRRWISMMYHNPQARGAV